MPIDARIPLGVIGPQIDDPLTVQTKRAKLSDLMAQQQLQQMQIGDAQRAQAETQTLNELYRTTGGDPTKIREGLASGGLGSRIPAFDKQQAELGKLGSEAASGKLKVVKERLDLVHGALSSLLARPDLTQDHVRMALTGLVQQGVIPAEQGAELFRNLPPDPGALRRVLMQFGMQSMDASKRIEMLTPKIDYKQTGKALVPVDTNAFTNPNPRALAMTTTPGEDQSRDVSIRGQNVSAGTAAQRLAFDKGEATRKAGLEKWQYDKERGGMINMQTGEFKPATQDGVPIGKAPGKPIPASVVKLQNEELSALGTFAGLDSDLTALQKQLTDGTLKVGPIRNLTNAARNYAGMSSEESRNLASFKAKMENMRNAVLLLNKGVQTEGDAQRAMDEIMSNINDPKVVAQRLAEVQALNRRAVDLRKANVDTMRSNFGAEPMDYGKFDPQPAAVNLPKPPANSGWSIQKVN